MLKRLVLQTIILFVCTSLFSQKRLTIVSPNGKLAVNVNVGDIIDYEVLSDNDIIVERSPISMTLGNGIVWGIKPKLIGNKEVSKAEIIQSQVYKKSQVYDEYKELKLRFKGDYNIIFRIYNEGVAYRFESINKSSFIVKDEQVVFNFPADHKVFIPYVRSANGYRTFEDQLSNPFENIYTHVKLSEWDKQRLAFAPILIESMKGRKIAITEADLNNYPGMYFRYEEGTSLNGFFARYPDAMEQSEKDVREESVLSRKDYVAECEGNTLFPWRVLIVSENDKDLLDNDMVYKLAEPPSGDFSWVKPGKVSWDWWNSLNLSGVDFKAGINNDTYKHYIDFASENKIEYIVMDEGWSDLNNLYQVVPEINLEKLIAYAKSKNVDIILWIPYYAFSKDIEGVCKHYAAMGIKGFKIDFMDRDDQLMVDFHYSAAKTAAKYRMLIDYHGTYKPTGLQRTFPNVLNFEGVYGLENCKWMDKSIDMVTYDVTFPFIRMLAGPVDYTPGAMLNATKESFHPVFSKPMSQGTRARQLAQYIIYEAPLNMLADSPSNYRKEKECTQFIADIPTIWDETKTIDGEVSKYIAIARRKGNSWYVGALTNWDKRVEEIDLSFLDGNDYRAEIFRDNINSDRDASDYKKEVVDIPDNKKMKIVLMPGGGCVMKIIKK